MELLAPVGNIDSLKAAVENGANALYLGGKMFSARSSANNFSLEELKEALDYAHLRGVKIYVAVNTLVADEEIKDLLFYLKGLQEIGVDAIIVQDLGVLNLVRRVFPKFPIHISTQMTIHNLEGVVFLEKLGVKRIVLSRELSAKEIGFIKANSQVELEIFVHGALCISYSGQCLMSSIIGARSGNRGRCAQPCRLPYQLVDCNNTVLLDEKETGLYLLSPRDLKLIEYLPEVRETGVDSLKIEGRMKKSEYVATVVRIYRQAIDRLLTNRVSDFSVSKQEEQDLAQIFNRDFNSQYFLGKTGRDLMSYRRPNNRGIYIGRVDSYQSENSLAFIKLENNLAKGDGIEIWVSQGGRVGKTIDGLLINGEEREDACAGQLVQIKIEGRIRPGDRIFKTHDERLSWQARKSFNSSAPSWKLPLGVKVIGRENEPLIIEVKDREGRLGRGITEFKAEKALKRPLTREFLEDQLNKLGNTVFYLEELFLDIKGDLMVPISEINQARRRAIKQLEQKILRNNTNKIFIRDEHLNQVLQILKKAKKRSKETEQPLLTLSVTDFDSLKSGLEAGADRVYLGGELLGSRKELNLEQWARAYYYCLEKGKNLYLATPRILKDKELNSWREFLSRIESNPPAGVVVANLGILNILKENYSYPISIDYPLNVFNSFSLEFLVDNLGPRLKGVTLSPELTFKQLEGMVRKEQGIEIECLVEGYLPLMVLEHCLLCNQLGGGDKKSCQAPCQKEDYFLRDRLGVKFPLKTDPYCRTHVLNSVPLSLLENLEEFRTLGINTLRIEGRGQDQRKIAQLVNVYKRGMDLCWGNKGKNYLDDPKIRDFLGNQRKGFTKGHYFRGV